VDAVLIVMIAKMCITAVSGKTAGAAMSLRHSGNCALAQAYARGEKARVMTKALSVSGDTRMCRSVRRDAAFLAQ
jgi:hypothetical protein